MSWSIGGKVLDAYDDPGLKLLAASAYMEKVAHLPMGDPDKLPTLEDRQFGVVFLTKKGEAIRKYPLNDLTNTVLSSIYFDLCHDKLPPEAKVAAATQIRDASVVFGMKPFEAVAKFAADASVEGRNYVRLDAVEKQEARPIALLEQLKEAYADNRGKYSREDRIELAQAMSKYGVDLHDDLKPFAIKDPEIDGESFFAQCASRKQLVQDKPAALHLLDEFVEKHAMFDPKETVKLLETFDKEFGLDAHWDRGLEPNLILQEKVAYHAMPIGMGIGGMDSANFSEAEVKSWVSGNAELLKKMFGKELAEKITADPMHIHCLPEASRKFVGARMEYARDNVPSKAK